MKLTEELIAQASKGAPSSSISDLALPNKELQEISSLKALANLVRLDLNHNRLQSIKVLSNCRSLKWLSVASNDLQSLCGIEALSNLVVLNCSCNKITSIREVEGIVGLGALIANDNEIKAICKLQKLMALNTLVLSKNPISSIGVALEGVSTLHKLSLSNCELQELGSIKRLVELKELRLAYNSIKYLSKELEKNSKLRIVDLGSNSFKNLSDIEVLSTLPRLKNLNVRGNPFCLQATYIEKLKTLLPALQVLDGHPLQNAFKKKPSNNQSVLPSAAKLMKGGELEGLHTSNKTECMEKVVKAVRDQGGQTSENTSHSFKIPGKQRHKAEKAFKVKSVKQAGVQEGQVSEYGLERLKKPKKRQKSEKASKDEDIRVQETVVDDSTRKDFHNAASNDNDSEPFIELIGQEKTGARVLKELPSGGRKKADSGLVSVIHNQSKVAKQKRNKHTATTKTSSVFSIYMGEAEVGEGGKSSWD